MISPTYDNYELNFCNDFRISLELRRIWRKKYAKSDYTSKQKHFRVNSRLPLNCIIPKSSNANVDICSRVLQYTINIYTYKAKHLELYPYENNGFRGAHSEL